MMSRVSTIRHCVVASSSTFHRRRFTIVVGLLLVAIATAAVEVDAATGMVDGGDTLNIAVIVNCHHPLLPMTPTPHIIDTSIVPITECGSGIPN
jgi:hypothetical protein